MARYPEASATTETLSSAVYSALARRAEAAGGPVYRLHVGDTYREPPWCARAEHQRTAEHPRLHNYAPVQGEPRLLAAIARRVRARAGVELPPEGLQVMAGATAGFSVVTQALFDPGDEVMLLAPFWPLIRGIVAARGARAVEVPFYDRLAAPGFDPERAIAAALTARTRALYINTPNNPTGAVVSKEVLAALVRLAEAHDLWLLWDDAYEDLVFAGAHAAPAWADPRVAARSLVCHTLSKSYGLAGARVGYTHGPVDIMRAVRAVQTYQTYCAPRPMQHAAAGALDEGDGWIREACGEYGLAARAAADAVGATPPEAGTFLFFDTRPHRRAGESALALLERCADAGVLLTPGAASGRDYDDFARLCFTAVPPGELALALERLRSALARPQAGSGPTT